MAVKITENSECFKAFKSADARRTS